MKAWTIAGIAMFCAAPALAAEQPADFAYGAVIDADGSEALYEVVAPVTLYEGVARADLGDVRVFNGAGEVVPHAWRPRRATSSEAQPLQKLTLFPLRAQSGENVDALSIRVQRSAGGAVSVNVMSSGGARPSDKQSRVAGYLIDNTALERALRALDVDWKAEAGGFSGKLRVDGSDDLAAWRPLVTGAPLLSLEVGGQKLEQKRIELPQQKLKYLRLSWLADGRGQAEPELTMVRGELADKVVDVPREWAPFKAVQGEKPGEYVFDTRAHAPIDRIRFELPELNTVAQFELLARDATEKSWRTVARGVAYRLRQQSGEITSPDLAIGVTADRYWLLRVDQRGGGIGSGLPQIQAGWLPHRLVFSARGAPPFLLAYGNGGAKPAAFAIETLVPGYREDAVQSIKAAKTSAAQKVNVRHAAAFPQNELGGAERLRAAIDWKRWSLWGALVVGVLILGAMAWRLMRQLAAGAKAAERDDAAK
ncbi:MAG: DUF3999 domain-containing protein [Betaproteobacteria bacterium]|nr:DUF3999 domain-containing protein [Betaproteobacteria bacterium]